MLPDADPDALGWAGERSSPWFVLTERNYPTLTKEVRMGHEIGTRSDEIRMWMDASGDRGCGRLGAGWERAFNRNGTR